MSHTTTHDAVCKHNKHMFTMSNVTSLTFLPMVSQIQHKICAHCISLHTVNFSGCNVSDIPNNAFIGCKSLVNIIFPNSLCRIGHNAFKNCTSLASLILPKLSFLGMFAFSGCTSLVYVKFESMPETMNGNIFFKCTSLVTVVLSRNFTCIKNGMFANCCNLTNINLPHNIQTIEDFSFSSCHKLQLTQLPDNLIYIYTSAFYQCYSICINQIPIHVQTIGPAAFKCCTSITHITFNDKLEVLSYEAFASCTYLTAVTFIASSTIICSMCFKDCIRLTDVKLPCYIEVIHSEVFNGCISLTNIDLHSSIEKIESLAFARCTSLQHIRLPPYIKTLESFTFKNSGLVHIILNSRLQTVYLNAFNGCKDFHILDLSGPVWLTTVHVPPPIKLVRTTCDPEPPLKHIFCHELNQIKIYTRHSPSHTMQKLLTYSFTNITVHHKRNTNISITDYRILACRWWTRSSHMPHRTLWIVNFYLCLTRRRTRTLPHELVLLILTFLQHHDLRMPLKL